MQTWYCLVAIGATLLGLSGCETVFHHGAPENYSQPTGLLGRWELVSVQGGMVPGTPPVPREVVEFAPDSTVRFYLNGQLQQQYRFRPTTGNFCTQLNPVQLLRFAGNNNPDRTYAYQISGTELILDGNICVDGTISRYRWLPSAQ
jgi:hypothetical protein